VAIAPRGVQTNHHHLFAPYAVGDVRGSPYPNGRLSGITVETSKHDFSFSEINVHGSTSVLSRFAGSKVIFIYLCGHNN